MPALIFSRHSAMEGMSFQIHPGVPLAGLQGLVEPGGKGFVFAGIGDEECRPWSWSSGAPHGTGRGAWAPFNPSEYKVFARPGLAGSGKFRGREGRQCTVSILPKSGCGWL